MLPIYPPVFYVVQGIISQVVINNDDGFISLIADGPHHYYHPACGH